MYFIHVLNQLMIVCGTKPLVTLVAFEVLQEEEIISVKHTEFNFIVPYFGRVSQCDGAVKFALS